MYPPLTNLINKTIMALSIKYLEDKLSGLSKKLVENQTELAKTTRLAYKNRIKRRIEGLEATIELAEEKLQERKDMISFCE